MENVVNKANKILNELNINTLPIDPYEIADKLNCKVLKISPEELPSDFPCDKNNFAGALVKNGGEYNYILINKYDSQKRQNFTIAHELGHLVLHDTAHVDCRESIYSNNTDELEANEFAGSLLMPKNWIKEVIQEISENNSTLSEVFNVSKQAIEIRRRNLNI